MKQHKIIIGSRGSQLALWQANWIKSELEQLHNNVDIFIRIITTSGDKIQDVPLAKIGGKGLFVKEIEEALLAEHIDIAVHSMKDVPMELPPELEISVITKRETPLDALISRNGKTLDNLEKGSNIGTSSLRRSSQLLNFRPDFNIHSLRGNVDTRLRKLDENKYDAIILASAGLKRLDLTNRITQEIPYDILLPAMGQGAVGIETRKNDAKVFNFVSDLNHKDTLHAVNAERSFVKKLDGGCQVPIGAYALIQKDSLNLKGLVASLDGEIIYESESIGPKNDAINIGEKLGAQLLNMGAKDILEKLI